MTEHMKRLRRMARRAKQAQREATMAMIEETVRESLRLAQSDSTRRESDANHRG